MEKILSIIIPSYNSKPFLAKCLDSLLCECTDRLDIIVVNDGSTDGWYAFCRTGGNESYYRR